MKVKMMRMEKNKKVKITKTRKKIIKITDHIDISHAIYETVEFTKSIGFNNTDRYRVATTVSELSNNIINFAIKGEIVLKVVETESNKGIEIIARDNGPGIDNIGKAMEDNFSTAGSFGVGLPGAKRLMDELIIDTGPGRGTTIVARKWLKKKYKK